MAERSLQQLDPLGAHIGRPMTVVAGLGIPLYSAFGTWINLSDIANPYLAVAALCAISASCFVMLLRSSSLRAPFRLIDHAVVTGLAVLAYLLSAVSMWDTNRFVRDDWGPLAIGFVLLAVSQYRPPAEIAKAGLFIALFAGVLALLQAHSLVSGFPPIMYSLVTMMPIIAFSLASALFGQELVTALDGWRASASTAMGSTAGSDSTWIARSVQQDRVTILNQEVVPFFSRVLTSSRLSAVDKKRATEIANDLRSVILAEFERSWLDVILAQLPNVAATALRDEQRLAEAFTADQRTVVRALLVAITDSPRYMADTLEITISGTRGEAHTSVFAGLAGVDGAARREFAPYLAVLRIMFPTLRVESSGSALALRFSYGR